jgi:hypothetical protein
MSLFERYKWPSIARDLVQMSLTKEGELIDPDYIAAHYGLTLDALKAICAQDSFQSLIKAEQNRAAKLGSKAEHIYRVEEMRGPLTEKLFTRLMDDETLKIEEFVRGYVALLKSAEPLVPEEKTSFAVSTGVNVQINVPVLDNAKLNHLHTTTVEEPKKLVLLENID